jgi:hypothetical protein
MKWYAFALVLGGCGTWAIIHLGDFIHWLDREMTVEAWRMLGVVLGPVLAVAIGANVLAWWLARPHRR